MVVARRRGMHAHGQTGHGARRSHVDEAALSELSEFARAARKQQPCAAQEE